MSVTAAPRWAGVLALSTMAAALSAGGFYWTAIGQRALVDRWERTAAAVGREMNEAEYQALMELSDYGWAYGLLTAVGAVPLVTVGVAALLFGVLSRTSGRPAFRQVLAVAAHASPILALRFVVAAPFGYAQETARSVTSLAVWMPMFDAGAPVARILGLLDVFVVWWAAVLAVGVAVLYGRPARRVAAAFVGVYVGLALALAGVMAVLAGRAD